MLTDAHRRTLETLADPSRRAGLRPDEREAVRAALEEVARLARERDALIDMCITPCSVGYEVSAGFALDDVMIVATREEGIAVVRRAAGLEVPPP